MNMLKFVHGQILTLSLYIIWTPLILPTNDCIIATAWLKCIPINVKMTYLQYEILRISLIIRLNHSNHIWIIIIFCFIDKMFRQVICLLFIYWTKNSKWLKKYAVCMVISDVKRGKKWQKMSFQIIQTKNWLTTTGMCYVI